MTTTLLQKTEDYGETSLELLRLQIIDKAADTVSSMVVKILVFLIIILIVFMLSIGASLWLGELLGKPYFGFFTIAFVYVILGLTLNYYQTRLIKTPVNNAIISKILSL